MIRAVALAAVSALIGTPAVATAQEFPPIDDRDFALDLYGGNALGSLRMVGMGGAAAAIVEGSAGMSVNPASVGVRPPSSTGTWDWDVHVDWLNPGLGADRDNNGIEDVESGDSVTLSPLFYFGGALLYDRFALGVALTTSTITTETGGTVLEQDLVQARIHIATALWNNQLVVGGGVLAGTFTIQNATAMNGADVDLFSITASALELGAVWMPDDRDLRAGAAVTLPATGSETTVDECADPNDCFGLIVPDRLEVPWSVVAGVGLRLAESRWNRKVPTKWIDEKYVLFAADLHITGAVPDGHGIEAFSRNQLQVSGDRTSISVRAGAEYEWIPGWLRVRGGSYYEPSRFRDPAGDPVPGRVHVTAGVDVRVWEFQLFRWRYRLRLSLTADLASRYGNGGLSVGFWR